MERNVNIIHPTDSTVKNLNSVFFYKTNEEKSVLLLVICQLKIHHLSIIHLSGLDEVSTFILKGCCELLVSVLVHLYNESFKFGVFLDLLKLIIFKSLHKRGNKQDIDNYRPISLTPLLGKIVENII